MIFSYDFVLFSVPASVMSNLHQIMRGVPGEFIFDIKEFH